MAKSRLTLLDVNVFQTLQNFYSNLHILSKGNQLRFNNLVLNCFDTAIETAWTYTYIFIVHSWFTVIYIVTKTLLPVRLCRLLNMLTVHNLFTVVYICCGNCLDTASETVWTRKYVSRCLYSHGNCSDTASETVQTCDCVDCLLFFTTAHHVFAVGY